MERLQYQSVYQKRNKEKNSGRKKGRRKEENEDWASAPRFPRTTEENSDGVTLIAVSIRT